MKEITGDIWDYHKKGHWIVITTNGNVKSNGEAVMGKGIALQAKQRFWNIAHWLGFQIKHSGNHCYRYTFQRPFEGRFIECGLFTFPTKHNWWEKSEPKLIEQSCKELVNLTTEEKLDEVYLPRPGCGNGGLDWKDVKPILEKYLDDRFVVVERSKECT